MQSNLHSTLTSRKMVWENKKRSSLVCFKIMCVTVRSSHSYLFLFLFKLNLHKFLQFLGLPSHFGLKYSVSKEKNNAVKIQEEEE